ncbi:MAG: GYD domain-containing protein [Thaumarchaeota archaeon]|nr:GYD domain-containing protein [Nitrososphaerota archaeon]
MFFIALIKFKKKARDVVEVGKKVMQNLPEGVKIISTYWTLGEYDAVWIYEAPNEKVAVKLGIEAGEAMQTQTLVAITRDEAMKLLE